MEDRKREKRQEMVYGIEQEELRRSDSPGGREQERQDMAKQGLTMGHRELLWRLRLTTN